MNKTFAYFGVDMFNYFSDDNFLIPSDLKTSYGHYFSHLSVPFESKIHFVYIGWSFLTFSTESGIWCSGFLKLNNEQCAEIYETSTEDLADVSLGLNYLFLLKKTGKYLIIPNKVHKKDAICSSTYNYEFKQIVTEDMCATFLTKDGKVFSCRLINGDLQMESPFQELILPEAIKTVACGKEHVLFLSNSGRVFSFGSGIRGQLGHGMIENNVHPEIIDALDGLFIKCIAAGGWHSSAISESGDLYMWGWNESGQLGFPCNELRQKDTPMSEVETICCLPKILDFGEELIKEVGCGSRHTAVLTESNHLWTWGWNAYGQLGHSSMPLSDTPQRVTLPNEFQPVRLQCKFWSTLITGCITNEKATNENSKF